MCWAGLRCVCWWCGVVMGLIGWGGGWCAVVCCWCPWVDRLRLDARAHGRMVGVRDQSIQSAQPNNPMVDRPRPKSKLNLHQVASRRWVKPVRGAPEEEEARARKRGQRRGQRCVCVHVYMYDMYGEWLGGGLPAVPFIFRDRR